MLEIRFLLKKYTELIRLKEHHLNLENRGKSGEKSSNQGPSKAKSRSERDKSRIGRRLEY